MLTVFTPGCKTNTQIQAFLQERRCCVIVYLKYGVTAPAREAIAIVLFTSGSKTNGVAVVLFTLDTVFLHERQRESQACEKLVERVAGALGGGWGGGLGLDRGVRRSPG